MISEEYFVKYCSPTLAGIKTANLFSCPFSSLADMRADIRSLNQSLSSKGIRILPLCYRKGRALIYIYRPLRLRQDLRSQLAQKLLSERGYCPDMPQRCLLELMHRLEQGSEFPHEIGLFLGYPPEDVFGFIENRADGYKLVGSWKVYGDPERAQRIFDKYRKCTQVYRAQLAMGRSVEWLTVAG